MSFEKRKFDGKYYEHYSMTLNQKQAEDWKKYLKEKGYLVRITTSTDRYHTWFDVWKYKKNNGKKYVVRALDKRKGYRVNVSKEFETRKEAEVFKRRVLNENKISIPRYRFFENPRILCLKQR